MQLFIGTYTRGTRSKGIYRVALLDNRLSDLQLVAETENPSYLAWGLGQSMLYAVIETADTVDFGGAVVCFSRANHFSQAVNSCASGGADPCHISVDPENRFLLLSNYSGGSLSSVALGKRGELLEQVSVIHHEGGSGVTDRQRSAHVHSTLMDGDRIHVMDLGLDQVLTYPISRDGEINQTPLASFSVAPGAGPRHMAVTPDRQRWMVINELDNTIVTLGATGSGFEQRQVVTTLPRDCSEASACAEVQVSPDGRFVYASNRGHDSIAVFAVAETGLTMLQVVPSGGIHPRHFHVLEHCLVVANRDTNNLVVLPRDKSSGMLDDIVSKLEVPAPVYVLPEQGSFT